MAQRSTFLKWYAQYRVACLLKTTGSVTSTSLPVVRDNHCTSREFDVKAKKNILPNTSCPYFSIHHNYRTSAQDFLLLRRYTNANFHFCNRYHTMQKSLSFSSYGLRTKTNFFAIKLLKSFSQISDPPSTDNPLYTSFLESLVEEYRDLWVLLQDNDNPQATTASVDQVARFNFLSGVVAVIEKLHLKQNELKELSDLLSGEEDEEMAALFRKELNQINYSIEEIGEELMEALVGDDPADHSDIVLEVTAGVGGQEAMLFCLELFNMYCNYALQKGWTVSEVSSENIEIGGCRRGYIEISGDAVYKHLKHEAGVHRVQRVPKTEKAGRIHTSTVSVSVLPQPREIDVDIQPKDLKIETFRNSGPGGQSVNTTDSAVRITHLPTGTVSECKQERSQLKNRDYAMKKLKQRIYQNILKKEEAKRKATRKMQQGTRGRSEKIRTYNFNQDRITDHRVKENCSNISEFLSGGRGLDELIDTLNRADVCFSLQSMLNQFKESRAYRSSRQK